MKKDFFKEKELLWKKLGNTSNMVLSTSACDIVTSRMVSVILFNDSFYLSSLRPLKKEQIEKNPNVALCIGSIQMKGKARICGSILDEKNKEIAAAYKNALPESFEKFSLHPDTEIIEIKPVFCKWWKNPETFDGIIIDFIEKNADSL